MSYYTTIVYFLTVSWLSGIPVHYFADITAAAAIGVTDTLSLTVDLVSPDGGAVTGTMVRFEIVTDHQIGMTTPAGV